jgi:hypothetical protein
VQTQAAPCPYLEVVHGWSKRTGMAGDAEDDMAATSSAASRITGHQLGHGVLSRHRIIDIPPLLC